MEKRCYECMEPIGDAEICPNCGFNNKDAEKNVGFNGGKVLKERYYLGNIFSKTLDSTVYIAFDEELDKKVFVREFTGEGITKISSRYTATELKQKFLNYAKGTATLNMCDLLPHTVDAFAENEECYLVTDYFDGESLKTLLNSGIKISSSNALKMATQLLKGLEQIHKSGFIFGAISPETLYILKNGEVRIFGLASRFYDFLEDVDSRVELINPSYSAPELFEENTKIDTYSDVYSVAAILYRVLTDTIPAIGFLRSGGENLTSPRKINKKIPKNIQIALLNALNWQIESRTATTGAFLAALSSKKVKRVRSKAIIWANILGFFQRIYDSFVGDEGKKRGLLWLWIILPIIILIALIAGLLFFFSNESDTKDSSSSVSVQSEDGWYYGNGEETLSSNDYEYGDNYENNNSSKRPTLSSPSSSKKPTASQQEGFPSLLGDTLEDAKDTITKWECVLGKITYKSSSDYLTDSVMWQSIKEGTIPKKGTVVDLVICKNLDVVGKDMKQAAEEIIAEGFENIDYRFTSSTEAYGTVIGAEVSNDKVVVTVSGVAAGSVPEYVGKNLTEAEALNSGIKLVYVDKDGNTLSEISDEDKGMYIVEKQDIAKNTPAYEGMTVTLTVSQN